MKTYSAKNLSDKKIQQLFTRPAGDDEQITESVRGILKAIKKDGDKAAINFAKKFDGLTNNELLISDSKLKAVAKQINPELQKAIDIAAKNIELFHLLQKPKNYSVETMPGVKCERKYLPIENVGLYIPGGSAVLFSTMLMLGIPAKLAGCRRVVVCSPLKEELQPELAYAAKLIGVDEFYNIGGAHAIGMMAYGTKLAAKVDKIFGPGNQYVTAAKTFVSTDPKGCLIDMPAGPSEALIIADEKANTSFVAADLLSQAEHGIDSQVILLTTSETFAYELVEEVTVQLEKLTRSKIAKECLKNSFILIVDSIEEAIALSNYYAPEHLIINAEKAEKYLRKIKNAGSVFVGAFSTESAGDYASGTNHSLPTYGYAKATGGVSVESFMKTVTFQKLTKKGLRNIAETVIKMAEAEKLDAHANAVKVRLKL
ncbi:MAG: histidinol dehydrogenase [Ignavibacteria bacterium]|nr:MAG: histidinol dehydrogenase [Ignavibacteria bacterium]KAF0159904.1 MAG: histidinol dehydrogenase [Ignavibacteria bacterium]